MSESSMPLNYYVALMPDVIATKRGAQLRRKLSPAAIAAIEEGERE
jgi:hypothetical protein